MKLPACSLGSGPPRRVGKAGTGLTPARLLPWTTNRLRLKPAHGCSHQLLLRTPRVTFQRGHLNPEPKEYIVVREPPFSAARRHWVRGYVRVRHCGPKRPRPCPAKTRPR